MKLSIIIVNYRTAPLTHALVESLLKDLPGLKLKSGGKVEIVVVDNNSRDESVPFLRSDFPEITVIDNPENRGLAAGVNIGLEKSKGEYVLLLNPDMIALPGSIDTFIAYMDEHPEVGAAGGKLVAPDGKLQVSCFRFYKPTTILYRRTSLGRTAAGRAELASFSMSDYDHKSPREVDWIQGSCMMVRSKALKEGGPIRGRSAPSGDGATPRRGEAASNGVGGMDERFFLYFEDVDWCKRFWQAGWKVMFVPQTEFAHFHQRSSEQGFWSVFTNRPTREHIKSAVKYFLKHRN